MTITIDGTAASGKSTVSMMLAEKLKIAYLNSGAFYRAVTYLALLNQDIDGDRVVIARNKIDYYIQDIIPKFEWIGASVRLELVHNNICKTFLLQKELFSEQIDAHVSQLSRTEVIRAAINARIREICNGDWVVEGRDVGTNIFPNARFKFFFDARLEVRAQRRQHQSKMQGSRLQHVAQSIEIRDARDKNKGKNSLKAPDASIYIDTTYLSIEQTFEKVYTIIYKYI